MISDMFYITQVCGLKLDSCQHECVASCHDRVVVPSKGPGDPQIVKKPCPPCSVLVNALF